MIFDNSCLGKSIFFVKIDGCLVVDITVAYDFFKSLLLCYFFYFIEYFLPDSGSTKIFFYKNILKMYFVSYLSSYGKSNNIFILCCNNTSLIFYAFLDVF